MGWLMTIEEEIDWGGGEAVADRIYTTSMWDAWCYVQRLPEIFTRIQL